MRVLLDTTVLIDIERNRPKAIAGIKALAKHELCISTITANEFFFGAALSSQPDALKNASAILNQFRAVDVDMRVALAAATLEAHFRSIGAPRNKGDFLIAATAIVGNCDLLVTANKAHFTDIAALKGKVKDIGDCA